MKVIMAQGEYHVDVVGLIKNTDDEVVYMNNWLYNREPGMWSPYQFKVYHFDAGNEQPMSLATMCYTVAYQGISGKVST